MPKRRNPEDIYYPVPASFTLEKPDKPKVNNTVIKQIIRGAVKGAFELKNPREYDYQGNAVKPSAVATQEQMEIVIHLIESLQPADTIEAALASQFAITYIRGLEESSKDYSNDSMLELFSFGHQVLETLTKYRTKGAQLISVNYNHNQGQINNIKIVDNEKQSETIEVNNGA
ncbi:MAG: hypothetical protein EBZ47_05470 [Chlamydiae bacterium]|nr:hypothetical protein [Chlamydiota bacterium]